MPRQVIHLFSSQCSKTMHFGPFCGTTTSNIYKHTVSACSRFTNEREFVVRFISNKVCTDLGNFLHSANMESFLCALPGAKGHTCFNNFESTYDTFLYNAIEFVSHAIRIYMKYSRPSISFSSSNALLCKDCRLQCRSNNEHSP